MSRRPRRAVTLAGAGAGALALALALGACDTGDGRTLTPPTTIGPVEPGGERTFTSGEGTLDVLGDPLTFTVTSCIRRVPETGSGGVLATLAISGSGTTGLGEAFRVTITQSSDAPEDSAPTITDTIGVSFGPDPAQPTRRWEAQRTVDSTGTVTDPYGEATTPLLAIADGGETMVVTAEQASFQQLAGFADAEAGPLGTGSLTVTCR